MWKMKRRPDVDQRPASEPAFGNKRPRLTPSCAAVHRSLRRGFSLLAGTDNTADGAPRSDPQAQTGALGPGVVHNLPGAFVVVHLTTSGDLFPFAAVAGDFERSR
jgi:hypothetical protein